MRLIGKLCLLTTLEVVLIGAIISPCLVYDTKFTEAYSAYYRNPTNKTKEKLDKERIRVGWTMMFVDMLVGTAVLANSMVLWRTGKKMVIKAQ